MRSLVLFLGALLAVALLSLSGCSSLDPMANAGAAAKCDDWSDVYCDRVVACGGQLTRAACLSALATSLDCSKAAAVSPSFDRCMTELRTFDCSVFDDGNTLPASCDKAIEAVK